MAMSNSESQPTVDGKLVDMRLDDDKIYWAESGSDEGSDRSDNEIPRTNIIAFIPDGTKGFKDHDLLYAIENPSSKSGSKQSPLLFRHAKASNFPDSLVSDLTVDQILPWLEDHPRSGKPLPLKVIISTGSGTGLANAVWEDLVKPLLTYLELTPDSPFAHQTTSDNSVTELTRHVILPRANAGHEQLILLLSGDGGVIDILNALVSQSRSESYKRPVIALLPLGTGNALANSIVVANDNTFGLRTLLHGAPKGLPTFRATFSAGAKLVVDEGCSEKELEGVKDGLPVVHGAVVCSWGLHAALVADSDTVEYRKHGAERFKMAAKEALFPSDGSLPHAYTGRVSILRSGSAEWQAITRGTHGYVLATLVEQLEAGFTISPASTPLDGKLRLVHFGHMSGQEAMEIMGAAYKNGKHVDDERVGYEEIDGLRVEFDEDDGRWRRVCVDGKIVRVEKGGWVELRMEEEVVLDLVARRT